MATIILKNAHVSIGGVDLSDHVRQITLNYKSELQDDTAMGDNTRSRKGGLKDWDASIEFLQDYATGSVDATLFSNVGGAVAFVGNPDGSATSVSNPRYSGTGVLESYNPLSGTVGDLAMTTAQIQAAGDLARATA